MFRKKIGDSSISASEKLKDRNLMARFDDDLGEFSKKHEFLY